ncbi:hypothetical protein [Sporomusa termitida]|uniref:Uncharacterized protein n=1 Tax=Sporomusa termitida TaxID=2377 RepID=A0A517DTH7_9FIRM|nr:hypothetical protein [Sporomusa termitida]QDR80653.1 hypothetical protein SPTER_19830 [Sporomusa termitida]
MATLKDIERVYGCEINAIDTPPFTTTLPVNGTVGLCSITVPTRRDAYLVRAVINWSVTFTPILPAVNLLSSPGAAQVQFEILKDGGPIARVTQSLGQLGFIVGAVFNTTTSNFGIAALQVLDTSSLCGTSNELSTFEVRATNINLTVPLSVVTGTIIPVGNVVSAVGHVSLVVEQVDTCRQEAVNS